MSDFALVSIIRTALSNAWSHCQLFVQFSTEGDPV